ncbi:DNA-directed RNA polymerase, mitochondrial-like isoform X2 [Mercenaria mercenaria]|nr:DNA-directed RNA polymerase, mitochondrial-like isoform X2 [Mercenaria mercenaria]
MSQILRVAGRFTVSSIRSIERHTVCESCLLLRNGFREYSTQTKFEHHLKFFKKRRWKKKKKQLPDLEELHQQLVRMVDARFHQLSSSSGKRTQQLDFEVSPCVRTEYHRLNKDNLRLAQQTTDKNTCHQTGTQDLRGLGNIQNAVGDVGAQSETQTRFQGLNKRDQRNIIKEQNQSINYKNSDNPVFRESNDLNYFETLDEFYGKKRTDVYEKSAKPLYTEIASNAQHTSVIKNEKKLRQQEFDTVSKLTKDKTGLGERHVSDMSDKMTVILKDFQKANHEKGETELTDSQKEVIKIIKQKQKVDKGDAKLKKGTKKRRQKAMFHEVYGRKSKKIHEKKEKLKNHGNKMIETPRTLRLLNELYDGSKPLSNLNVTTFDEGLKEAKCMFSYKPEESSELLSSETLFEGYLDKDLVETEESVCQEGDIDENVSDIEEDHLADTEKSENCKADRLPDAEWAVIKAIRKKKKDVHVLSVEEMGKLEMLQDVFHEDMTIEGDLQQDYVVPDWAQDVRPIEGTLTKKAQKKREKQRKDNLQHMKVDDDLILHTKQEMFNQDLLSYVQACVFCGITNRALEDIKMYRAKDNPEYKVNDVRIYNIILRGLGKEDKDLYKVREVFSYIREDGLDPDLETYMLCLSCIGKASDYDLMLASFIVKDMINEGLDVKDIFNQCTFQYNERSRVYQILTEVVPDFEPNPPVVNVKYDGPLVEPLNEMLPAEEKVEVNPFTCGMSKEEIMKAAEEQFGRELDGLVTLNSIFKTNTNLDKRKRETMEKLQEQWRIQIKKAFLQRKNSLRLKTYLTQGINIYPFFCLFPDDDYVKILCQELQFWLLFSQMYSPSCALLRKFIINRIRQRFSIQQMIELDVFPKLHKAYSRYITHLTDPSTHVPPQRQLWKQIIQDVTDGNSMERPFVEWSDSVRFTIGDILFDILVVNAKFDLNIHNNKPEKMTGAFFVVERSRDGKRNMEVRPHPMLATLVNAEADLIMPTEKIPSLCPPVPFTAPGQGGNFISTVDLLRWCMDQQVQILKERTEEAGPVLDSLNVLSTYAWKINKPVLDVALKVFKEGGNEDLEIPVLPQSILKPHKPDPNAEREEVKQFNKKMFVYKKSLSEAVSLWWSGLYKLSIANELRDRTFWLATNIDFRGRAYPIAPHLHHQNQDHVKAFMLFAKGKPLGEKGLDWLKLHLVNLTEHKKRSSLEDRLKYADEMMAEILDSADNPLTGRKWWMTSDSPWQTLAACIEIAAATRSGDPCKFVSHFPVHQDGSCNGLQHYAALGRDVTGAKSVNLKSEDETPADVYSDVVDLVKKEIEFDIENETNDFKIATICQPYLERKVIKQSIMTTVYGVTMYGAKLQIQRQLGYKEFPDEYILVASRYLAEKTFKCLNNLFTSARQIQSWFEQCSIAIGKSGHAVEWETPLNLVCIQPYYKNQLQPPDMPDKIYNHLIIQTHALRIADVNKQRNGFPPNFIHSLDSVHMMLTSLYCYR